MIRAANYLKIIILIFLATSCTSEPEISGFDKKMWQEDKMGCQGFRSKQVDILLENQKSFQGKSERSLIKVLGKPDKTAFYKRNIRNLIYFTEPGGQCNESGEKIGKRIVVELNAMGNVTWINEEII